MTKEFQILAGSFTYNFHFLAYPLRIVFCVHHRTCLQVRYLHVLLWLFESNETRQNISRTNITLIKVSVTLR